MRESRTYGSGRGARGNSRPYRERNVCCTAWVRSWHQAAVKPCAVSAAGVSGQMVKPRRVRLPAPVRNRSEFESIVAA